MVSTTVTVAVPVLTFPLTSVKVKVTVFAPIFEQVKLFGKTFILAILQLSEDPLFNCEPVIETFPEAFK